jgi:ABC-type phosphate transport system substrate-binding protein
VLAIVFATSGGATVPPNGVNCQMDGKISGRGATFQTRAQQAFIAGFTADVCGKVTDTASGDNMVQYNTYAPQNSDNTGTVALTGSGYGRKATLCRTDAFGGTDGPYSNSQLAALRGDPHTQANLDTIFGGTAGTRNCQSQTDDNTTHAGFGAVGFGTTFFPPYQPKGQNNGAAPSQYPMTAPNDPTGSPMSFPVAGSAVAIAVNFTGVTCTTTPTTLQFTGKMLSRLMGGDILNWNDLRLQAGGLNPDLAGCDGPVTRVVRLDDSGTTQIDKNYLAKVDPSRTAATGDTPTCDTGQLWSALKSASGPNNNQVWPGFTSTGSPDYIAATTGAAACSAIMTGDINGNNGVLDACTGGLDPTKYPAAHQPVVAGTICYADLPDELAYTCPSGKTCAALVLADMQNAAGSSFQPAQGVGKANCSFGAIAAPVGSPVGLAATDTWSNNNAAGNRGDVTNTGTLYPLCGVTFDFVFKGLAASGATSPITSLGDDQRRTLYSYFLYILSSAGQSKLGAANYAPLSQSLLDQMRPAFITNF